MIPIYEQGSGKGIGHSLQSFCQRFDKICAEHLAKGRARAFAFIFYDFTDRELRQILKDQGAFAKLDRLSGTKLSLFYLHTGKRAAVDSFNAQFLSALGVEDEASLPCVVFFRVKEGKIIDVELAQLEKMDLIHGFHELFVAIENYLQSLPAKPISGYRAIRWLKGSVNFVSIEVFRAALKYALDLICH
jgi:hypothetical protein